jgi:hypothetical protein
MKKFDRRDFLKLGAGAFLAAPLLNGVQGFAARAGATPLLLDASADSPKILTGHLKMGTAKSPTGATLALDSRSLLLNGKPWLPVMGEFHFSRYPAAEWREELLKMKAGGIDIVATYVFWIHHEEVEGQFDWTGQRDLRRFVALCKDVEMPCVVRLGPWCRGEVRNGGLPDWIMSYKIRSDDPAYLAKAKILYAEIFKQCSGLLWKDGGPIAGVQVENEYRGAAEHLMTLKRMGVAAGFDVPLYTRTGWPMLKTPMPAGEIVPLFGVYAEGFWDRDLTAMPGDYGTGFMFWLTRADENIGTDQLGEMYKKDASDVNLYPYFCCEIGGGMMPSYHRRIKIYPKDVEATAMIKIGSGNNLQGYYMYHGGTNPPGKLTTLHESQATKYWNDLPVKTYDFQAPLGEFGRITPQYHSLRRMHTFLRDFGPELATMNAFLPAIKPFTAKDKTMVRWSARTDGRSGYIFVNNYQRMQDMPAKTGVQFAVKLKDKTVTVPAKPVTVPANSAFFLPFNKDLNGVNLAYATAQPIAKLEQKGTLYVFFSEIPDVAAEFVFEGPDLSFKTKYGFTEKTGAQQKLSNVKPGTGEAINVRAAGRAPVSIVLLSDAQSLDLWKGKLGGKEYVFLTGSGLALDGSKGRLTVAQPKNFSLSVFPRPNISFDGFKTEAVSDGLFTKFGRSSASEPGRSVRFTEVQKPGPPRAIKMGSQKVAEAPDDADFEKAAVWRIALPKELNKDSDAFLKISYTGDVARVYLDGKLLTDNFYNGNVFELGLKRFAPDIYGKELLLKILPLRKDAPVYLAEEAKSDFAGAESVCRLNGIELVEEHTVTFKVN